MIYRKNILLNSIKHRSGNLYTTACHFKLIGVKAVEWLSEIEYCSLRIKYLIIVVSEFLSNVIFALDANLNQKNNVCASP